MGEWVNAKGWLDGYCKKKDAHKGSAVKDDIPYAVPYYPVKCPRCGSKKVKLYKTNLPIRYYTCKCGWHFKSIERD